MGEVVRNYYFDSNLLTSFDVKNCDNNRFYCGFGIKKKKTTSNFI